uniref:Type II beta-Tyr adenylation domain protein n=1 Tax=Actinomadura madurae TaxID=1993 RepID=B0BLP1_9ACTN|nr:type II beta-Tyr adenylation domain protein [Actinomadura madurae]
MTAIGTAPHDAGAASGVQAGFRFLDRMAPDGTAHRIRRAYEVRGPLDVPALRDAWTATLDRHELLRTAIGEDDDGRPVPLPVADPAASFVRDGRPRHVGGAPATLTVTSRAPDSHRLLLDLHPACADERSVAIVLAELSYRYARAVGAEPGDAPPEPRARYLDHAARSRAAEAAPAFRRSLAWWAAALTPPPEPPDLPADGARSGVAADRASVPFTWTDGVAEPLARLCERERVRPDAVLLAALHALLHRYGGAARTAVGVPCPVRPAGSAGVVGPFENLLVHVADSTGDPSFRELVRRTARTLRAAREHRAVPFDRIVRTVDVPRAPDRLPLCDVLFRYAEDEPSGLRLPGAEVRPSEAAAPAVAALALSIEGASASRVAGTLGYRTDMFGREAAEGVLTQLRTLLAAALTAPETPADALPLTPPTTDTSDLTTRVEADPPDAPPSTHSAPPTLPGADPSAATDPSDAGSSALPGADLSDLSDLSGAVPGAASGAGTVHGMVLRSAARVPGAVAVSHLGEELTYAELERESSRIAAYLRGIGAEGAPVAIRAPAGTRRISASLGALRAGAHLVWFGPGDVGERGRQVLTELRPACLLLDGDPEQDPLGRWYRDELGGRTVGVSAAGREPAPLPPDGPAGPATTVYVAHTSGSTGRPKGVAHTHASFAQFLTWMADALDIGPGTRLAQWAAPEHDPSLCEVFATLAAGGTLCPVPDRIRAHPERLVDWLVAERITFLQVIPGLARELLKELRRRGGTERLAALDRLVLMGEALPGELADALRDALPGARLANVYGPTETIAATWYDITGPVAGTVPIGRPIPGRQVLVLDGADRPCPTGVTGELVIRSPYAAAGYVGGIGDEAFRPVPGLDDPPGAGGPVRCYRTGDLARRRWDGLLEFRGRRDHQVKLSGVRLELAEIEAVLAAQDSVAECAVVPVVDGDGLVSRLVAYVVPGPDGDAGGATEWRARLRGRFGASVRLVSFETLRGPLPRNAAGKIDRRRLPVPGPVAVPARAPKGAVEGALADIWRRLLDVEHVDAGTSFFAAGGHSLLLARLASRIRRRFGVEIPLLECLAHPTLAGMSALIEASGGADAGTWTHQRADVDAETGTVPERSE